jgi:D-alanine-D-alanine ligase
VTRAPRKDGLRIVVLMGGISAEREVSLVSGRACAGALRELGHTVSEIDVGRDLAAVLAALEPRPQVVFNALHGRYGEDGCIQGLLEFLAVPYTHSGVLASALAMDKPTARRLFAEAGLPCAEGRVASRAEVVAGAVMEPPYVVKPLNEGSSVGVHIVLAGENLPPLGRDWPYGDRVLVERYIPGRELTCAVMGDVALGVIDIVPAVRFYDYEAKYAPGGSKHILPAEISPNLYQLVQRLALEAHQALGCRGVTRTDFRFDDRYADAGELVCLEVNTQPGMTETSLVPELPAHAGHSFGELVRWMVEDASCNR